MYDELKQQVEQAAAVLKSCGAKEVYLFGSAATGRLREDSDIDMAVSGLPPGVFFEAWGRAVRSFPRREMDLLCLDWGGLFVDYLRSRPAQGAALRYGFRPVDPAVPLDGPDSPFSQHQGNGLRQDLPPQVDLPTGTVLDALLDLWSRQVRP